MFASEAKQSRNDTRHSSRTVLAVNLGTEHTTYKRVGARNVLNGMCKLFEGMWPKSGLGIGGIRVALYNIQVYQYTYNYTYYTLYTRSRSVYFV